MCIGGGSGVSGVDPAAKAEQEEQRQKAMAEKKEAKTTALAESVEAARGTGRRSLITGTGGGMGYFNRYKV